MRQITVPILAAAVVISYGACGHSPPTDPQKPAPGCASHPAVTQSPAASLSVTPHKASPSTAAPISFHRDSGCAQNAKGSPRDQLSFIENHCVRASSKVAEKAGTRATSDQLITEKLSLDSPACLRIALASDLPSNLTVKIIDPNGVEIDKLDDSSPLVFPRSGPVCVSARGQYTLTIQSKSQATLDWSAWVTKGNQ